MKVNTSEFRKGAEWLALQLLLLCPKTANEFYSEKEFKDFIKNILEELE